MMQRLTLATTPWSQDVISTADICAIGKGDSLTLGGHEDNLLVDLNALLEAEKTRKHELSTVADGVDSAVLDDDALVGGEESSPGER